MPNVCMKERNPVGRCNYYLLCFYKQQLIVFYLYDLKVMKSEVSGAGVDDVYTPSLPYYKDLLFLADTDESREITSITDLPVSKHLNT